MRTMSRERDTGIALLMGWQLSSPGPPDRRRNLWMPRKLVVIRPVRCVVAATNVLETVMEYNSTPRSSSMRIGARYATPPRQMLGTQPNKISALRARKVVSLCSSITTHTKPCLTTSLLLWAPKISHFSPGVTPGDKSASDWSERAAKKTWGFVGRTLIDCCWRRGKVRRPRRESAWRPCGTRPSSMPEEKEVIFRWPGWMCQTCRRSTSLDFTNATAAQG